MKKSKKNNQDRRKSINWLTLVICLVIIFSIAIGGSLFTSKETNGSWYDSVKPSITPPNWVFPIVWTILFFLISISLYLAWMNASKKEKLEIVLVFEINLVLNLLWSIFYFGMKNPLYAFFIIILLFISIISMIVITYRINKKSAYLVLPYLLWVCFAMLLNYLTILKI